MVELHVFPHTVRSVKRREVKVATLGETAAVVSDAPADLQRGHTALTHLAVLRLDLRQVEAPCRPPVFLLLRQQLQSLEVAGRHHRDLPHLVALVLSPRLASGLPGRLSVLFVSREVRGLRGLRGLAAWQGESWVRSGAGGDLTVGVKQCAKDHLGPVLLTLLTPPSPPALPLPPPALSRLFPLPRLDQVFPHLHRPVGVVQLLVEAAGVTDGRTLSVPGSPPQRGLVGPAVEAPGVRAQPEIFLLQRENYISDQ